MNRKIRLSKSVVGQQEVDAVARVILEDGYLGMGKEVQAFEQELQAFLDTDREVICVNTGTAALHLAVMACVKPGEEVLVPSLTYVASFQAISAAGAIPVPCDIVPATGTINVVDAEKRLSERTRAVMPVHYASSPGDLEGVYRFAQRYGLRVIEDAAHAFGCLHQGKLIGSFGDVVCFSFDGIKNITSGEGGAIVTADKQVAQFAKDARLLGVQKDTEQRYKGQRSWEFDVIHQGYRYHMSNVLAAIGRVQLKRFPEFKQQRQQLARLYQENLASLPGLCLFDHDYTKIVPHIFPIRVLNGKRDLLRAFLLENGIECGIHYYPNHYLTYYSSSLRYPLPRTEEIYEQLLTLPLHPDLTKEQVREIIQLIKGFLATAFT